MGGEVILGKKPSSNKITAPMQLNGLKKQFRERAQWFRGSLLFQGLGTYDWRKVCQNSRFGKGNKHLQFLPFKLTLQWMRGGIRQCIEEQLPFSLCKCWLSRLQTFGNNSPLLLRILRDIAQSLFCLNIIPAPYLSIYTSSSSVYRRCADLLI